MWVNFAGALYTQPDAFREGEKSAAAAPSPVLGNLPPGEGMPVGPVPPGFFQFGTVTQDRMFVFFSHLCHLGTPEDPDHPSDYPIRDLEESQVANQCYQVEWTPQDSKKIMYNKSQMRASEYGGTNAADDSTQRHGTTGAPGDLVGVDPGQTLQTQIRPPTPLHLQEVMWYGPPGGGGPPGTPIMPSPADSTNSGDNMYTMINTVPPGGSRPNFPMGAGGDGPLGGMAGMEPHHMNGSLGSGDMDSLPKNSPGNLSMSNQPGTPREDGEMGGNFLNPFQNESYSPNMTMSV
ncbi:hypothetical protein INR49_020905 [Caranx melampygus]|nr:hypothetical protein INR49_020905 [Caranx melampygus]